MTFLEHLEELRSRILKSLLAVAISLALTLCFSKPIMGLAVYPHQVSMREQQRSAVLEAKSPTQNILPYIKVSFIAALFLASPVILYQMWCFIGVGLYRHERRAVLFYLPFSLLLFLGGIAFGYTVLVPEVLKFLSKFGDPGQIQPKYRIDEYLSFFTTLTLAVGMMFQIPLVMLSLNRLGLADTSFLVSQWRLAIVISFVIGAFLTPPDPVSQILMALPIGILYGLGLLLCVVMGGRGRHSP